MIPDAWKPMLDDSTRREAFESHFAILAKTDEDKALLSKIASSITDAKVPNPDEPTLVFSIDRLDGEHGFLLCTLGAAKVAQTPIAGFSELVSLHDSLTVESDDEDPLISTTGVDQDGQIDPHWAYHEELDGPWVPVIGYDCMSEIVFANSETGAWGLWSHESDEITAVDWSDLSYGQVALRLMAGHLFEGNCERHLPK